MNRGSSYKPKIIAIVGPTSSGKSDLAVRISQRFGGEVVSADSRQVYRELDIGTGKITKKEMGGIPHHMLDIASPKRKFTVVQFQKKALEAIAEIHARGKLPILCGGTGLYIQSVVDGIAFPEIKPDRKLRASLGKKSAAELSAKLKKLDRKRWATIDRKNPRRLIRAIEIATQLGAVPDIKSELQFDALQIGIRPSDARLRMSIVERTKKRLKKGMIAEAKRLHESGMSLRRMRELGLEYRVLADYLEGNISKQDVAVRIVTEDCNYSKRQMTWFKKDKRIMWFNAHNTGNIEKAVGRFLAA